MGHSCRPLFNKDHDMQQFHKVLPTARLSRTLGVLGLGLVLGLVLPMMFGRRKMRARRRRPAVKSARRPRMSTT